MLESLLGQQSGHDRSAEATEEKPAPPVPNVGLVLGGGSARGFAHIGILRVLAQHGIVPDVIVGTSIGAVVGACYACGQFDDFEKWARSLTTRNVLSYLDLTLNGSGLIGGDRLSHRLEQGLGDLMIEDLPIKFAAIATELGTGHEIWLTRGRLAHAVRASYALPGIFTPVKLGGRWLTDGALVNPVPVSAARALGARIVIAVNLNADLFGRGGVISSHGSDDDDRQMLEASRKPATGLRGIPERLLKRHFFGMPGRPGLTSVMTDAFNIMQDRVTRARLAGDPPDIMISPRLGQVNLFDFHRANEIIDVGARTAEKKMDEIADVMAHFT